MTTPFMNRGRHAPLGLDGDHVPRPSTAGRSACRPDGCAAATVEPAVKNPELATHLVTPIPFVRRPKAPVRPLRAPSRVAWLGDPSLEGCHDKGGPYGVVLPVVTGAADEDA